MCELTVFGGNVAKCMHFDVDVGTPDHAGAVYVISIGLVSNGVAMLVI